MSYCRWGSGDVYMFEAENCIVCCACNMDGKPGKIFNSSITFANRQLALAHLYKHRKNGDCVPEYAVNRLKEEIRLFGTDLNVWDDEIWKNNAKF